MLLPLLLALTAAPDTAPPRPSGDVLVVANQGDATVHLVDVVTGRTLGVIPSAPAPHEVAVSSDGRWAVATNYGDRASVGHGLTVIDLSTLSLARSIDLSPHQRPHGIAFLPGDSLLLVTAELDQALLVVDFRSGAVRRVLPTGQRGTHILATTAGGRKAFTANVASGTVSEVDLSGAPAARSMAVGPQSEGAAVSPDGRRIWSASMGLDSTFVLDAATGERLGAVSTPGHAYRVAITADGATVLVPEPELGIVRLIDTASLRTRDTSVPGGPGGPVVAADGSVAYVPLMQTGQVAVVDLRMLSVLRVLPTGQAPDGMAISRFYRH
jgi:DNA-binding beta-propeller fold protein YncE